MSLFRRRTARTAALLLSLLGLIAVGAAGASPRGWELDAATRVRPPKVVTAGRHYAFPLHVSKNGRYLVDRRGVPFMIVGDSPQALIGNLSVKAAAAYIANRKAAGFDALWVNLLCRAYTGCRSDGSTFDGIAPFTRPGDLSTPNPAYFNRAAAILRLAQRAGMAVFLDPIETGGWLDVLRSNGAAGDAAYGRFVGRRFRSFHNIVWLSGNDFQSWKDQADDAAVRAVALGIRSADPAALQTVELDYLRSASRDDPRWRGTIKLDAAYTYFATYAKVLQEYERRPPMPVFLLEAGYEFEQNAPTISYGNPQTLRRQEYWTALSGTTGQFYGNHYTWQFADGWEAQHRHPRERAARLPRQPPRAAPLVPARPGSRAQDRHEGLRNLHPEPQRRDEQLRHDRRDAGREARDLVPARRWHDPRRHEPDGAPGARELVRPDLGQVHRRQGLAVLRPEERPPDRAPPQLHRGSRLGSGAHGRVRLDFAVVGGGLVGLATARALLERRPGARLAVFEKEPELGRHQSGRNSGVVHAGVYYPPGSLKARLCREGRAALRAFADQHGIPYTVRGKVIVATSASELPRLDELKQRAVANGVQGVRELDPDELREIEPHVSGFRALHVPESAVIDFQAVLHALADDVRAKGGEVLLGQRVERVDELAADRIVVCAGLQADRLAPPSTGSSPSEVTTSSCAAVGATDPQPRVPGARPQPSRSSACTSRGATTRPSGRGLTRCPRWHASATGASVSICATRATWPAHGACGGSRAVTGGRERSSCGGTSSSARPCARCGATCRRSTLPTSRSARAGSGHRWSDATGRL